jgi:Carboxypeptidase regulatory-like domain
VASVAFGKPGVQNRADAMLQVIFRYFCSTSTLTGQLQQEVRMLREARLQALSCHARNARPNGSAPPPRKIRGRLWNFLLIGSLAAVWLFVPSRMLAQVTATLTGAVQDTSGAVIPGADVTLTNEATGESRVEQSNGAGLYAFPSLVPGTYDLKAAEKGFKSKIVTGIVLNAGDTRTVPAFNLEIGAANETITVSATSEMIPVENGAHTDVLSSKDIDTLALEGQDTTELLRVLPGTVEASSGLSQTAPMFSDLNITVDEGAEGGGIDTNGSIYRGGTSILVDGAETIDIGNMANSLVIVEPDMTSEVSVQSSNMSADQPFGPLVISTISKSGSQNYHGDGFFDARNNVLNANGWQQKDSNPITPLGAQHYYYPGGSVGGPVPGTHKHLLFWGGYEKWLQNQGNANVLTSFIPTPEMMKGDFSEDNTDNQDLCPNGFYAGQPPQGSGAGPWCSDLGGTVFANGAVTASAAPSSSLAAYKANDYGQTFPMGSTFVDPGAAALAKIWPKATSPTPLSVCNGCNYYQPIVNVDNGWIYRFRIDYILNDNTKIYGSMEQAYSSGLAQGNGAHLYWTPGNAIPFPGGGEVEDNYGKVLAGHIVHNFNSTTTNDFLAAWAFGQYPFTTPNPSAAYKTTLGYPSSYGKVFSTKSLNIPAYSSAGSETFPDFSQASIFENPPGKYAVKKEAPQFADTLTKVWGTHTIKMGGFTQTTDNYQSSFSYDEDGLVNFGAAQNNDSVSGTIIGSPYNSTAQFVNGVASGYSENNSAPIGDVAELNTAAFVDDTWKTTRRLTAELGIRLEHVGHWYDRDHIGLAVFYPDRVLTDYEQGKYAPGYYWHAIDAGVPLSGQPNRFAYPDGRFGLSYDVFGTGNTVVRGGWGVYRYVTQVNTVANGEAQGTADDVLTYGLPTKTDVQLQNIGKLAYTSCPNPAAGVTPPCGVQGGQTGLDAGDYGQPMTQAFNLTVDQRLPWNSQLEVAYVGSQTSQLVNGGEDIESASYVEVTNQNKMPIGALFSPDPVTGHTATNPENVACDPNLAALTCTSYGNQLADYHPFGYAYGTNGTFELENTAWANYNALQASWIKTSGKVTFDFNGTWSKMLGTTLQENPYEEGPNYGPTAQDRPVAFNASYTYSSGTLHYGNNLMNQLAGGWTITGISQWQAGTYIPAELGLGVPNFGMGLQYTGLPADTSGPSCSTPSGCSLATDTGITNALTTQTYFGTDEGLHFEPNSSAPGLPILPVLTCNPTSGLANHQVLNGKCFNAPAVGTQGGTNFPYMRMTPYFDNDLALYRTFHIHENQNVQFRASAFDWLNHSLLTFASASSYSLNYNVDYTSKTITPNYNQGTAATSSLGPLFGLMTVRSALPYARVIELDVKYSF